MLSLVDPRVSLDGVQGMVQPPGAFEQADARVEQVVDLLPPLQRRDLSAVDFAHPGGCGPAAAVNGHLLPGGLGEVVPDVPPVADLERLGQGLAYGVGVAGGAVTA